MRQVEVLVLLTCWIAVLSPLAVAADPNPTGSLPIDLTDEEKQRLDEIGVAHRSTAPPVGGVRNPAEWESAEGVIIRWPLGISVDIVAEMSEDVVVTTVVASESLRQSAMNAYAAGGVNMANAEFIIAPTDSYWTRDYGPWFIFADNTMAIADHIYNRPRPLDDVIPQVIGQQWRLDVYGLDLIHAGGNHMSDGLGTSMSTELVYHENPGKSQAEIHDLMLEYLGNDYDVLEYIESGGIHHIDCWGKLLGPATVLIKQVDAGHPSYDLLNQRADFLAQQISAWGVPYDVVRVYCPSGTAYTNSLILNDKVLVPTFGNSWDAIALQVYRDAMPGYEVLGFPGSWVDNDALHCRAMGVPDRGMLFIDHVPFRAEDITSGDYPLEAKILAASGEPLIADGVKVRYSADGALWQDVTMTSTGDPDTYLATVPAQDEGAVVRYYIEAADESGRVETHPFIGAPWAHEFAAICPNHPVVDVTPDGPVFVCPGAEVLLTAELAGGLGPFGFQWTRDGDAIPGAGGASHVIAESGTHAYNCQVRGEGCVESRIDESDVEVTWQDEPVFDGATQATTPQHETCTLDVGWDPATPPCGGPVYYDVYRSISPEFVPGPTNLLVSGVAGTAFRDTHDLLSGRQYSYIVQARDDSNGAADDNAVSVHGTPWGPSATGDWADDCEGDALFAMSGLWSVVDDTPCVSPGYQSPTHVYYFGVDASQCDYATGSTVAGELTSQTIAGITAASWLTFASYLHTEQYAGYDQAFVEVSADGGGSWDLIDRDAANGGSIPDGGGAWSFRSYPLDAYVGQDIVVRFRFDSVDDVSNEQTGWLLDDVTVTQSDVPGVCETGVGCTMTVNVTPNGASAACAGEDIVLTAAPLGGEPPYEFQWLEDGVPIPGATSDSWTVSHATAQAHVYNCGVTDSGICIDVADGLDVAGEWVACGAAVTVADGSEEGTSPLTVSREGDGLTVWWDATTPGCASTGYHLIWGWGAGTTSYGISGADCDLEPSGGHSWMTAPDTSDDWAWFLVVGDDGLSTEGGWGTDSAGDQRSTTASGECGASSIVLDACVP